MPRGFWAGAVRAGIRPDVDKLDVGLLYSEAPCTAAAVYTSNRVKAAPLLLCQEHLVDGRALRPEEFKGYDEAAARAYIRRVQELIGVPIDLVSVGPERDQAIIVKPIL